MELVTVTLEIPQGCNVILGHSHFIKSAEDLFEILVGLSTTVKFGLAFCEASGPCLIRVEGNDPELERAAERNASAVGCGHVFVIVLRDAFPIHFLNAIKSCPEVCTVFCATANPVQVIVAHTEQGRGVLGVIDGSSPKGREAPADRQARRELLRKFGYKL